MNVAPSPHNMQATEPRHFIGLTHIDGQELRQILMSAKDLKWERTQGEHSGQLQGKTLTMIFEKPSTRTRMSFDLAMTELGGHVQSFNAGELQLGRGETLADTARVMSRYVDAIMVRANAHSTVTELAEHASIPVINGLTDHCHPCQVMADILTFEEKHGDIKGKTIAWIGDGNNMANSWIAGAAAFGYTLRFACPDTLQPKADVIERARAAGADVVQAANPAEAVADSHAVVTDTWVSMGDENKQERLAMLADYQVTTELMAGAQSDAIFMHCLPAHRGEEVTAEVIDGPQSVVWDEAENRLHVQKAILLWSLGVV